MRLVHGILGLELIDGFQQHIEEGVLRLGLSRVLQQRDVCIVECNVHQVHEQFHMPAKTSLLVVSSHHLVHAVGADLALVVR